MIVIAVLEDFPADQRLSVLTCTPSTARRLVSPPLLRCSSRFAPSFLFVDTVTNLARQRFLRRVFTTRISFALRLVFLPDFAFFSTRSFHADRNAPSSTSSL